MLYFCVTSYKISETKIQVTKPCNATKYLMMMMMMMMMMMDCFCDMVDQGKFLVLFLARMVFKDPHDPVLYPGKFWSRYTGLGAQKIEQYSSSQFLFL